MNPYGLERLAKQRTSDASRAAGQLPAGRPRRGRTWSIRHRTGWALIKLGLSVIPTSKGGPAMAPAGLPRLSSPRPVR